MAMRKGLAIRRLKSKNRQQTNRSKMTYILVAIILLVFSVLTISSASVFRNGIETARAEEQTPKSSMASFSEQHGQLVSSEPQFDVQLVYVYVGPRKDHFTCQNPFQNRITVSTLNAVSLYPVVAYFNFTRVSNSKVESFDARMEVYMVQLSADTGTTESYLFVKGTNFDPAFSNLDLLSAHISDFDEVNTISGFSGGFTYNWTENTSILGDRVGSYGLYTSGESNRGLWNAGTPSAITVSVRRIGSIQSDGESVFTTLDETVGNPVQTRLERFGDGFLYNTIVARGELSRINLYDPPIPIG